MSLFCLRDARHARVRSWNLTIRPTASRPPAGRSMGPTPGRASAGPDGRGHRGERAVPRDIARSWTPWNADGCWAAAVGRTSSRRIPRDVRPTAVHPDRSTANRTGLHRRPMNTGRDGLIVRSGSVTTARPDCSLAAESVAANAELAADPYVREGTVKTHVSERGDEARHSHPGAGRRLRPRRRPRPPRRRAGRMTAAPVAEGADPVGGKQPRRRGGRSRPRLVGKCDAVQRRVLLLCTGSSEARECRARRGAAALREPARDS